eukprot:g8595.t1
MMKNNSAAVPVNISTDNVVITTDNRLMEDSSNQQRQFEMPQASVENYPQLYSPHRPLMPFVENEGEEEEEIKASSSETGEKWTADDFPEGLSFDQFVEVFNKNIETALTEKEQVQESLRIPKKEDGQKGVISAKKKVTGETLAGSKPSALHVNIDPVSVPLTTPDLPSTSAATSTDISSGFTLQRIDEDDLIQIKRVGTGTTGKVHLSMWLGSEVATKEFYSSNQEENERYCDQEADNLNVLKHPCVVYMYGRTTINNHPAIVLEYIAGGSLKSQLRELRKIDQKSATGPNLKLKYQIALQAASGVEYLHSKSLIHFDLKAENFLCDLFRNPSKPVVKVADVGLSKMNTTLFVSGNMRGTLPWMAPELMPKFKSTDNQYSPGPDKVDKKVDVYSFGVVLWEIWNYGAQPYGNLSAAEAMQGFFRGGLKLEVPRGCPQEWGDLMEKCWDRNPVRRPTMDMITSKFTKFLQEFH